MVCCFAAITWRPKIGDPDFWGWGVTSAYFMACLLCFLAGRKELADCRKHGSKGVAWFWFGLTVLLLGLGINKQLDLQTLLTQIGRQVAKQGGWFAQRKKIQGILLLAGAACGVASLGWAYYFIRHRWRDCRLAFLGIVFLLGFVVIRAASIQRVDRLVVAIPHLGPRLNAGLDLSGTILIGLGALLQLRPVPEHPSPVSKPHQPRRRQQDETNARNGDRSEPG